ncbi:MAG: Mycothiol S-conjugate amidase [bacterium]|nr:Mycothiol S-conjugate amidase [bacterium]
MKHGIVFALSLIAVTGIQQSFAQLPTAPAYPQPDERCKADILLILAHPDDETAIGSYLAKAIFDEKKRVAIIYTTRGTGGGNSHGNEQATALGAIREIENRRATSAFGIENVWFIDGRDTPGQDVLQSLQRWNHAAVLEQVVRLIRLTRPEVIMTWLPHYVAGENHGDHQAAGVIATEAFDLAGNPTIFPAQVAAPRERLDINNFTEGLRPWQPKKLYFFSDASHAIPAEGPRFDMAAISPARQVPYYQLAAELQKHYLTQGEVSQIAAKALATGDFKELQKWLRNFNLIFGKAVVKCDPMGEVFAGITSGEAAYAPVRGYQPEPLQGISLTLGGAFAFYREFWKAHNLEHLGPLVAPEMEVGAGSYVHIPLLLRNDTPDSVEITLTSTMPAGWRESSGSARYRLGPFEIYPAQMFFFAPAEEQLEAQAVIWKAAANGKAIGSVGVKVVVKDWTLPQ